MALGPRSEQWWRATDQIAGSGSQASIRIWRLYAQITHFKNYCARRAVLRLLCGLLKRGGGAINTTSGATGSTGMPSNMTPTTSTKTDPTNGPNSSGFGTGISGTVAAPSAATFGSAPPQLATSGGPSFDGSSGSYSSNATFPLITTALQKTSTGLSPTPSDPAATLTVISDSSSFSNAQLVIPSVGVNQTITNNTDAIHLTWF